MRRLALFAAPLALLAGCGSGGGDHSKPPPPAPRSEAATIKAWSRDVSAGKYDKAADYFAKDAVVIQGAPLKLTDHGAAVAFNKSLPCRSVVTDVKRQGTTFVAAFRLRKGSGPATACDEAVRVRFTFRGGKFAIFRQLPDQPAPSGDQA